jgi:hypothetical protein
MMTATRMALKNPNTAGEIKFNLGSCQWGVQGTSQSPTDRFGIFRRRIAGVNLREASESTRASARSLALRRVRIAFN